MMKNVIITLSGKTGSGKSEVAKILTEDYGFKEYSFGDPIRKFMSIALPNIDYHVDEKARQIAIEVAEAPKKIAPKCWAYHLTERIISDECPPLVVISDLRFNIELQHLKETLCDESFENPYHLYTVRIISDSDRHFLEIRDKLQAVETDKSNTEHEDFQFDWTITNDGGYPSLWRSTFGLVNSIKEKEGEVKWKRWENAVLVPISALNDPR